MASVRIEEQDAIAHIVLDRPQKKNALADGDWTALRQAAEALSSRRDVRCVMVRGEGGHFSAGWDIGQAAERPVDARRTVADIVNPALLAVRNIPVPTIAAVSGVCLGGGLGIAMACDIVLAAEDAVFGSPFRALGLVPDSGAHWFLRQRLGHHKASELIYTGRMIDGREARRLGLVCEAFPADTVLAQARAMAQCVASGPTLAFAASKHMLNSAAGYEETLALEAEAQGNVFTTQDAVEGLAAFHQKRKARFSGR